MPPRAAPDAQRTLPPCAAPPASCSLRQVSEEKQKLAKLSGATDMEKVTDFQEEKEMGSDLSDVASKMDVGSPVDRGLGREWAHSPGPRDGLAAFGVSLLPASPSSHPRPAGVFCGFQAIAALSKEAARKRAERAAALAAVKVTDEDITLVQTHMELSDKEAELALRTNGGDVALTLRRLVTPNTAAVVAAV